MIIEANAASVLKRLLYFILVAISDENPTCLHRDKKYILYVVEKSSNINVAFSDKMLI